MPDSQCLRVVFAGTPEFAAVALEALLGSSDHALVGVLTQPDRPSGRGRKLTASPVKQLAEQHRIPVLQPETLKEPSAVEAIAALRPDVLVVAAYGLILPTSVLTLPPKGCLNIHASLLPRWRGAAPIHRAILAGDRETGVCIMQMDEGLDTGDVLQTVSTPIGADETTGELHDRLAAIGAQALLESLSAVAEGVATAVPQSQEGVSYAAKLHKSEARLDFHAPSVELHRQILGLNPWPVADTVLGDHRLRVWRSRLPGPAGVDESAEAGTVLGVEGNRMRVRTGDGCIELLDVQRPGKTVQAAAEVARALGLIGQVLGTPSRATRN